MPECLLCVSVFSEPFVRCLPCRHTGSICRNCIAKQIALKPVYPLYHSLVTGMSTARNTSVLYQKILQPPPATAPPWQALR